MEQEKIRELLAKYYNGETSAEEELILREYLGNPAAPDSLTGEFGYLAAKPEKVPEPSEGFESRLEEVTRPEIGINPPAGWWKRHTAVSAAVAVVAGTLIIFSLARMPRDRDTFSDPALAMAEVKSILLNVSERMNTGTSQLQQVSAITSGPEELSNLKTINGLVGKNLSRLRYLGDIQARESKKETE